MCWRGFERRTMKRKRCRQPPTSLDEVQPQQRWFPLWHWFHRTRHRMPASKALTDLIAPSLFRHLGGKAAL